MSLLQTCIAAIKSLIERCASRKFIAFVIATQMTYAGYLQGSEWVMVAMVYMAAQGVKDIVTEQNGARLAGPASNPVLDLPA